MTVAALAAEIYLDLGSPDNVSEAAIETWLATESNLGKLNTLLDTDFLIVAGEISPDLNYSEQAIYKLLYQIQYTKRQININTGAAAYVGEVLEIKEGNRTIKGINKNDIAKTLNTFLKDINEEILTLVQAYRLNLADPRQTAILEDGNTNIGDSPWTYWRDRTY